MLDVKRRWGGRAVVGFIAGRWCRAVLEPVVVIVGGFAEGVVLARDMVMKPSPIGAILALHGLL